MDGLEVEEGLGGLMWIWKRRLEEPVVGSCSGTAWFLPIRFVSELFSWPA